MILQSTLMLLLVGGNEPCGAPCGGPNPIQARTVLWNPGGQNPEAYHSVSEPVLGEDWRVVIAPVTESRVGIALSLGFPSASGNPCGDGVRSASVEGLLYAMGPYRRGLQDGLLVARGTPLRPAPDPTHLSIPIPDDLGLAGARFCTQAFGIDFAPLRRFAKNARIVQIGFFGENTHQKWEWNEEPDDTDGMAPDEETNGYGDPVGKARGRVTWQDGPLFGREDFLSLDPGSWLEFAVPNAGQRGATKTVIVRFLYRRDGGTQLPAADRPKVKGADGVFFTEVSRLDLASGSEGWRDYTGTFRRTRACPKSEKVTIPGRAQSALFFVDEVEVTTSCRSNR